MSATSGDRSRGARRWVLLAIGSAGLLTGSILRWAPSTAASGEVGSPGPGRALSGAAAGPGAGRGAVPGRGRGAESGERESAGEGEGTRAPAARPRSLEGTEVDGALETDAAGHLVVGPRVMALFDYFFSATGEESEDVIRERIAALAAERLSEPALGEALDLLDRYEAYREAGRRLGVAPGASAADRLAAVRELRREHFGDAAAALFGDEERATEVAIEKARIAKDETLSPDERADLLAEAFCQPDEWGGRGRSGWGRTRRTCDRPCFRVTNTGTNFAAVVHGELVR
jgi:hypothetical protein